MTQWIERQHNKVRVCGYTITAKVKLYIELYYYSIELKVVLECRGARVSMTTLDVHSESKEIEGIRDFFPPKLLTNQNEATF